MTFLPICSLLCAVAFMFGYVRGFDDAKSLTNWGIGWDEGYEYGRRVMEAVDGNQAGCGEIAQEDSE